MREEFKPAVGTLGPAAAEQILKKGLRAGLGTFNQLCFFAISIPGMPPGVLMRLAQQCISRGSYYNLEKLLRRTPAAQEWTFAQVS